MELVNYWSNLSVYIAGNSVLYLLDWKLEMIVFRVIYACCEWVVSKVNFLEIYG